MDLTRANERFAPTVPLPVRKASTATWHCPVPGCSKVFRHQSSRSRHVSNAHKKKGISENNINKTISNNNGAIASQAPVQNQTERFGVRCRKIVAGSNSIVSSSSLQVLAHFYFDEKKFYWEFISDERRQVVEISFRHIESCVLNRVDPAVDILRFRVSTITSLKGDADKNWWDRNMEHVLSFDNGVIDPIIRRLPNCSFVMRVEIALIDSKDTNPTNLKQKVRSMLNYGAENDKAAGVSPAMRNEDASTYSAPVVTPASEHIPALSHEGPASNLGKRQPLEHGAEVPMWDFIGPMKAARPNMWVGNYLHEDAEVGSSSFPGSMDAPDIAMVGRDESVDTLQYLPDPAETDSWTVFPDDAFCNANAYEAEGMADFCDDEVDCFTNITTDILVSEAEPVMDTSLP